MEQNRRLTLPDCGLNSRMAQACFSDADGRLSDVEIATQAGVSISTVAKWRIKPEYRHALKRYREQLAEVIAQRDLASKDARLRKLNRHAERIEMVVEQRAEKYKKSRSPGVNTGLMQSFGRGQYAFDSALDKAYRGTLEQAAKESGGIYDRAMDSVAASQTIIVMPTPGTLPASVDTDCVELDVVRK